MDLKGNTCVLCINNTDPLVMDLKGTLVFYALITDPLVMDLKGNTCVLCINNMERILWLWT